MVIRYDEKLNREIKLIVNKYNAKVNRLNKQNKYNVYVPEKFDKEALKSLKASVNTRTELRRRLKVLSGFTNRGGEKNIIVKGQEIPKYQYESIKRYRNILSRKLTKREKFAKTTTPTYEGKKGQFTIAEQFNEEIRNIQALRERLLDIDYLSLSDKDKFNYLIKLQKNTKEINLTTWQQNYADMLLDTAYVYNIPHAKIINLREKILNLSPQQFDNLFKTESTIKQIMYYYNQINELGVDVAFENMESDVLSIYDSLFENIDDILKEYQ